MKTKLSWHSDMSSKASKQVKLRRSRLKRLDEKQKNDRILKSEYPPLDLYFNAMRDRYDR